MITYPVMLLDVMRILTSALAVCLKALALNFGFDYINKFCLHLAK